MFVKTLKVRDFRNWENSEIELSDGINVLSGSNAQGKTNLLEALYMTCVGRSMRTPRDKELIRWGKDRAYVSASVCKRYGEESVEIVLDKSQNKCVSVNRLPLTRIGELMGTVLGVLFSPEEIKTVKESPQQRRRFMDVALSQLSKNYFYALSRYNRILSQRNRLLKSFRPDEDALCVWDMQLAAAGAGIVKSRRGFLARLSPIAKKAHSALTSGEEELLLSYDGEDGLDAESIKANLIKALECTRESDLKTGFTHCGPHKDDLKISVGGVDIRTYGSQGQQRSAALSLQLALLELMTDFASEKPILLLDDVMSELDFKRRERLLELVRPYQTIITCTELPELDGDKSVTRYRVRNGCIVG